jgi:hypothetical protein
MRRYHWLVLALAAAGASTGGAPAAHASDVQGALVRPIEVIFDPADPNAARRVRIDGVAAISEPGGFYTPPACGYLYYTCPAGEESLCREQWKEIAAAASAGTCVSFGSRRVNGALVDNGRLRPATEPPYAPDLYLASAGLGVAAIDCKAPLFYSAFDLSGPCSSTGAAGSSGTGGAAPTGSAGEGGGGSSVVGAAGTAGSVVVESGSGSKLGRRSGCAVVGGPGRGAGFGAAGGVTGLAAISWLVRRRMRPGRRRQA